MVFGELFSNKLVKAMCKAKEVSNPNQKWEVKHYTKIREDREMPFGFYTASLLLEREKAKIFRIKDRIFFLLLKYQQALV